MMMKSKSYCLHNHDEVFMQITFVAKRYNYSPFVALVRNSVAIINVYLTKNTTRDCPLHVRLYKKEP